MIDYEDRLLIDNEGSESLMRLAKVSIRQQERACSMRRYNMLVYLQRQELF
jgi:hypothetical protein